MTPRRADLQPGRKGQAITTEQLAGEVDASLLDVIDNVLNQGVVLTGDLVLGVAGVDLIYAKVSALLCAADRVLPEAAARRRRARGRGRRRGKELFARLRVRR